MKADHEKPKGCEGCQLLLRQDQGYSNYTVTDTTLICLVNKNPMMPVEDMYIDAKMEPILNVGETCTMKIEGDPIYWDVDGEEQERFEKDPTTVENLFVRGALMKHIHGDW